MAKKYKIGDRVLSTVTRWTVGKSAVKGTKFIRVTLTNGITWTGYITPNTTAKTMETLETMGFVGSNLSMIGADNALDTETEVVAVIGEVREYNGNTYYNADWINKNSARGFDSESKDLLSDFDMDTRAYIADSVDLSSPASSESTQQTHQEPPHNFTTDDIPF